MSLIFLFSLLGSCLIGGGAGYLLGTRRHGRGDGLVADATRRSTPSPEKADTAQVDLLFNSLLELTSQVDTQVSEHTHSVGEISTSLESPAEGNSANPLVAAKKLISANRKLHDELQEARSEIHKHREEAMSFMKESLTDMLTVMPNRRGLDRELNRVFSARRRDGSIFSVLIFDIDHFKRINDRYGHMVGDQVLKSFARCIESTLRESDFVARFGGEEFVAILPGTIQDDAFRAAERTRLAVANSRFKVGELELRITTSIGVREVAVGETATELLEQSDQALYAAKNSGRNRSCFHDGHTWQFLLPQSAINVSSPGSGLDSGVESDPVSI